MREILFRAKSKDSGEWVEGNLFVSENDEHKICIGTPTIRITRRIDIKTIGQYIGKTDKNGKKIFEGDICLCKRGINDLLDRKTYLIKYDSIDLKYYGVSGSDNTIDAYYMDLCEVIGNIYDNPNLLMEG